MRTFSRLLFLSILAIPPAALAQEADLSVSKTGPEQATAGSDVSYTVTVQNTGPDAAANVSLVDNTPGGMTFVSATQNTGPAFICSAPSVGGTGPITCTIASLANGVSAEFTFVFNIPGQTPPGTFFTNVATVTSTADPNDENNSSSATTFTPPPPQSDVSVQKTGPSSAGPDTDIAFTLTVGNAGPDPATNFVLTDTLPGTLTFVSLTHDSGPALDCDPLPAVGSGGTITCDAATYPAGATTIFTLVAHVPAGTPSGTAFTNTATVSADVDPNEENNVATTTVTVSAVDLTVVKTGPVSAPAGNITYTITVENDGPDTAAGAQLIDPLPPGTTFVSMTHNSGPAPSCGFSGGIASCSWLSLGVGSPSQITLVIHSGSNTSITNTAFVESDGFDPNDANSEDSVTTTITPVADISVLKTGPGTIAAGTNATYTVTVTNGGPSNAANVTMTDILAPELTFVDRTQTFGPTFTCTDPPVGTNGTISCSIASLAANASATFSIEVHLASSATPGSTVSNTATASSTDPDPDNPDQTSTTDAIVTAAPATDLTITKTVDDSTVVPGATVTYTVVVTNDGATDALDVVVTDTLPAGTTLESATSTQGTCSGTTTVTCTVGTLLPSASATITLVVTLPATPGTFENTASATNSNGDPNAANNTDTASVTTSFLATDLALTKSVDDPTTVPGATVTYTIVVTNDGGADALDVVVTDTLPAGSTLESATSTQGTCSGTTTVTCTIGTLTPSASATITLVVTLPTTPGTFVNTATATNSNGDPDPANNTDTASVTTAPADFDAIPTLSELALALMALALAFVALRTRM